MRRLRGGGIRHEGVCGDKSKEFDMEDGGLDYIGRLVYGEVVCSVRYLAANVYMYIYDCWGLSLWSISVYFPIQNSKLSQE